MSDSSAPRRFDLAVVGAGMAGMAAAVFGVNRGLSVAHLGSPGASAFSSGLLDLLGVHPVQSGQVRDNPFAALEELRGSEPEHPYSRLPADQIKQAFDEFTAFLDQGGLPYHGQDFANTRVLTPVGTVKRTYRVPASMANVERGLAANLPALLVDFEGLKGYSARQIACTARPHWPGLIHASVRFPEHCDDHYPERMAMALENSEVRSALAAEVSRHLGEAKLVGFPAILGLYRSSLVYREMERLLGVGVFEIPTMPPGVPGLRLKSVLEERLAGKGVGTLYNLNALWARRQDGEFVLGIGRDGEESTIRSRGVVLATGRFIGRGLIAGRDGIRERLMGLPVVQPSSRSGWHNVELFDHAGHPVNRAGLATDGSFRPLGPDGSRAFDDLYVSGSILAHQDWTRQKCGSGLALATAYAAVQHFAVRP
jgi:glycerol-3-phosphate dehydrogenase subunit B